MAAGDGPSMPWEDLGAPATESAGLLDATQSGDASTPVRKKSLTSSRWKNKANVQEGPDASPRPNEDGETPQPTKQTSKKVVKKKVKKPVSGVPKSQVSNAVTELSDASSGAP